MSDSNFSAIRARLKYETIEDFIGGYARFISGGGMFIPMRPSKLKPVGTVIRFQFLLGDGTTALLGEGSVLQVRAPDDGNPKAPVGMLIKFTKLSQDSKKIVDRIVADKGSGDQGIGGPFDAAEEDEEEVDQDSKITQNDAFAGPGGAREYQPTPVQDSMAAQAASVDPEPEAEPELEAEADVEPEAEVPASEPELDLGDDWDEEPEDENAQETAEFEDPPTREAPDGVDLEPPTAEAAALEDELDLEPQASEPETGGPRKLAGTEGGLQVLAFDDMSDEELQEFQGFSFGEDDEDDFDDMFDGLFGGSEAADDFLGGAFDGPGQTNVPSQEIELPEEEEDDLDALLDQGQSLDEPSSAEIEAAAAILGAEDSEDSEEFDESYEEDIEEEEDLQEESEEVFELEEPIDDEPVQPDPDELALDQMDLDEPETPEPDPDELSEEDELDALIDFQKSPYEHGAPQVGGQPEDEIEEEPEEESGELESLLGSLDDDDDEEPELTLSLGAGSTEEKEEEPDDEESLEALLASAQKEIEEKQGAPEESEDGDILDQLLGDDGDLPPPPTDGPTFTLPDGNKKKKGGFISKLFGKD